VNSPTHQSRPAPILLALVTALLCCGCGNPSADGDGGANSSGGAAGSQAPSGKSIWFVDVTASSGIVLQNVSGDPAEKLAIVENIGQGAAAIDYDGDGLIDLFLPNGDFFPETKLDADPRSALYKNLGDFRFKDVTREAGLLFKAWCHGARAVDFDGDGDTDLYVTVYAGPNRFFRNEGNGTFTDASADWGGADKGPSTGAAFFDADNDGDLDLYVGNYVNYDPKNPPNNGEPCNWKGIQVSCGPRGTDPGRDTFYENVDGKLVEAGAKFGFNKVKKVYTLGVVTSDFDNDGDIDIYVANDSEPNYMFINQGGGRFSEQGFEFGVDRSTNSTPQAGMGVDTGDLDNDGRLDIFVTNFSHDYNTFYRNRKNAVGITYFEDDTTVSGLNLASFDNLSWGCRITDLDRDGWQDLIVVSGHVYPQVDGAGLDTNYAQLNHIYRNLGPGPSGRITFKLLDEEAGPGLSKRAVSRGLVTVDLDNDGDLDLFIVEMDETPTLLKNVAHAAGHWVGFALRGKGGNRDAIGARVTVTDSKGTVRIRERTSGTSFLSTVDGRLLVGLGAAGGKLKKVEVRWPDGSTKIHENLANDRYWVLDQARGTATAAGH